MRAVCGTAPPTSSAREADLYRGVGSPLAASWQLIHEYERAA